MTLIRCHGREFEPFAVCVANMLLGELLKDVADITSTKNIPSVRNFSARYVQKQQAEIERKLYGDVMI